MTFLPPGDLQPDKDPKTPSMNRIVIWVVVGGIGAYSLLSGIMGLIDK
ncbi:hypothetical protein [Cryobacterium psychrophilum]|nr:hypothetical protein [Cryobacterium psychrophilum]TDW29910.1 hypothetical protein EDD25_1631 [Cryobacterium psychrophilum]